MNPYISVVMPCLNEEASVGLCVQTAFELFAAMHWRGEVIVVDNGSTDRSASTARECGARVISVPLQGYGQACIAGLQAACGDIVILGDADKSYDFSEIPAFIGALERGYDLVLGSRFQGCIDSGAMPFLSHYIGNPMLTFVFNTLYRTHFTDIMTGMRAFSRQGLQQLQLTAFGMELASEMLISAYHAQIPCCEVPIHYYSRLGTSKLRPFSDGLRHLYLTFSYFFFKYGRN